MHPLCQFCQHTYAHMEDHSFSLPSVSSSLSTPHPPSCTHLLPLPHLSPLLTHLSCSPWPSLANLTPPPTFSPSFNIPPHPLFLFVSSPPPNTIKARKGKNEAQLLDNNNNNIYGTQSHKNPESLQRHKDIYAHFNTHTHTHTHTCSHITVDLIYVVSTSFPFQQFT